MDIYEIITDRIIKELEKGIIPWKKPWVGKSGAIKHTTGKPYSLLNQMLLGEEGEYLSYKQALEEGGCVRKGEKGHIVVFWTFLKKKTDEVDENGEPIMKEIPYLKYCTVFHVNQCDGIKPRYTMKPTTTIAPDENAQAIFDTYTDREGIKVHHEGDMAFYRPSDDSITLPVIEAFNAVAEYYSTAFHEAIHSTGAKNRLNRDGIVNATFFGKEDYSKEELVAEIGASMLLNKIGMETESSFENNAAYIGNWLKALKNDKRFIVSASSKAEKAVKFLLGEEDKEEVA